MDALDRQIEAPQVQLGDFDFCDLGSSAADLEALAKGDVEAAHGFVPARPKADKQEPEYAPQWKIVITRKSEEEQAALIVELDQKGLMFTAPSV